MGGIDGCQNLESLSLDLRKNKIGPAGGEALGESLKKLFLRRKVTCISLLLAGEMSAELCGNPFKESITGSIGEALKSAECCRMLRSLDLSFSFNPCDGPEPFMKIAEGLRVALSGREKPLHSLN